MCSKNSVTAKHTQHREENISPVRPISRSFIAIAFKMFGHKLDSDLYIDREYIQNRSIQYKNTFKVRKTLRKAKKCVCRAKYKKKSDTIPILRVQLTMRCIKKSTVPYIKQQSRAHKMK